jgi:hypothetical protein
MQTRIGEFTTINAHPNTVPSRLQQGRLRDQLPFLRWLLQQAEKAGPEQHRPSPANPPEQVPSSR